jgi:hypothetical protein
VIEFNEGTATLNGESIESGSELKGYGDFELIVDDGHGNFTIIEFKVTSPVPYIAVGSISVVVILLVVFRKKFLRI